MRKHWFCLALSALISVAAFANTAPKSKQANEIVGLLLAGEIATLVATDQENYITTIQTAFADAEESLELASQGKEKKSSFFNPKILNLIFGNEAVAGDENFCFMAGYLFQDPPCKPAPRFQGRCRAGEMECNPWVFGQGATTPLCATINYRNETRQCGGKSGSPETVLSFINRTPQNKRLYDDFVYKIERHCATGRNPKLCDYMGARLSNLNRISGGTIGRAYGAGLGSTAAARAKDARRSNVYRPVVNKLAGCDPITLMHPVNFSSSSASSLLSIDAVQGLICGRGAPPTAQYLATRDSSLARAISRSARGTRRELESARRNLQSCIRASKTKTLSTTLSDAELRTSPSANKSVEMCMDSAGQYTIFAQTAVRSRYHWRSGTNQQTQLNGAQKFPASYIGTMASFYQVDLCSLQITSCSNRSGNQYQPQPSGSTPRTQ